MTLSKFIHALGIPGIGPELALLFASHVKDLAGMFIWLRRAHAVHGDEEFGPEFDANSKPHKLNSAIREFCQHDGVGEKVAIQVRDGLELRRNLISELANYLQLAEEPTVASGGKFAGLSFCITGTLSQPRKAIQLMVKAAGGKVVGSISAKLDVLIAGENAGSKLSKAESLGVTVWSETQLMQAIDSATNTTTSETSDSDSSQNKSQKSLLDF